MDQSQFFSYLAEGLQTHKGTALASLIIVVLVGWLKTAPYVKDLLTTVARKRIFALLMAVLPVFALVLWKTGDWFEASIAGVMAFLGATGLNRVIPDGSPSDPVVVGEAVAKILEEKKDVPPVVIEEKKEEPKPVEEAKV